MCDQPGKDIRTKLIAAFDSWLHVPPEKLASIKNVVQMLHTASLMYVVVRRVVICGCFVTYTYVSSLVHRIDDVQDDAVLRRAVPVAHSIFGVPQTINSANYVYFLALQELLKLNQPHMITIYTEELINLHRGQGIELFWRDSRQCPTEEEYIDMVNNSKCKAKRSENIVYPY